MDPIGLVAMARVLRAATMADDELVSGAKRGEPAAWRELHARHAGRLVIWLQLRPTGDALMSPEDVASEAWCVAASKVHDFRGDADDFAGWLFGIARRIAGTARRTAQRRATEPQEPETLAAAAPVVEDHALAQEHIDWVRSVLASLSERERDVIGLVDVLGMDTRSAAETLGMSMVAVRVARHRGLRRLNRQESTLAGLFWTPPAAT